MVVRRLLSVTEPRVRRVYDEAKIAGSVTALAPAGRALFACACAERLMACLRWYCEVTGSGSYPVVREALDAAWSADGTRRAAGAHDVAALVPGDADGELFLAAAVAQNAVASVAYALEVRRTGKVQQAVWAARQLYDAADTVVQQGSPVQAYAGRIDQEPPVRLLVQGLYAALDGAGRLPAAELLASARQDGESFLRFVSGSER